MKDIWLVYLDKSNRKEFGGLLPDIEGFTGYSFLAPKIIRNNAVCKAQLTSFAGGIFLRFFINSIIKCRGPPLISLKQKQIDRRKYNDYYY